MFPSLLIANRGEIARRIIRTARRMGIRTIAVYSDADASAAFVRDADEAVWIGGAAAADSYLRGERIIAAALDTDTAAIHPGYGFLSENADFAEAVEKAAIAWVGPPPSAIRAMGLKDAAKALMEQAGVPVTPGYHGEDQSAKRLKAEAKAIGYPVLIKAVAGGGGRGMRRVDAAGEFDAALESAKREAKSSFGDDRVLVEKFIESPRHIEVQVFGDSHGNLIHLYERDCSLQRRRQKVIEEAPAPGMTDEVRTAMTGAALTAARSVGYRNAGTVEFIVDGAGALRPDGFWFMEMNTRLQVEHPVTEMVTGLDLVELQLRVASGEALPSQDEITLNGWAVEARLCAEDPARGFMPSSGRLERFDLSAFSAGDAGAVTLRLDSAVEEGDMVPAVYDSMIAKAIAYAPTRDLAMDALAAALREAEVWPVVTNAALLADLLDHPDMRAGAATTSLVEEELDDIIAAGGAELDMALAVGALGLEALAKTVGGDPWADADGFRLNASARSTFVFGDADAAHRIVLETAAHGARSVRIDAETLPVDAEASMEPDGVVIGGVIGEAAAVGAVRALAGGPVLFMGGRALALKRPDPDGALESLEAGDDIRAPMPGKILDVKTKAGADVRKGDVLVVLEAMKMEHALTAPRDGRVADVMARAGAQTAEGDLLVRLEPANGDADA